MDGTAKPRECAASNEKNIITLLFIAPLTLHAQELPIANHVDACGDGSSGMSDAELSEMHACVLRQRDAMGNIMDRWEGYSLELREACLMQSRKGNTTDYVELETCLLDV